MGQQQSSEKPERSTSSRGGTPSDQQKRVNRRQSLQALPIQGRASPANPSASNANAVAPIATTRHLETPQLEQYLQGSPDASSKGNKLGRSGSKTEKKDDPAKDVTSTTPHQPIAVPQSSGPMNVPMSKSKPDDFDKKAYEQEFFQPEDEDYEDRRYIPGTQLRPPRLPLPIADAILPIPESPSLDPIDKGIADVPSIDPDAALTGEPHHRRRSSMVSQSTLGGDEDDDIGDELPPIDPNQQTVPTTIEWNKRAHRVYLTGTFVNWERKYRMHHKKDGEGFSANINLAPGTHHLLFLVDEVMTTNPDLPTAVDFNNVLVNYLEIAQEDLVSTRRQSAQGAAEKRESTQYDRPEAVPEEAVEGGDSGDDSAEVETELQAEEIGPGDFRQLIPQALNDMELDDDDDHRYQQATQIIGDSQGPPSLPMFLSRSILNGITPVKDDNSVLVLPNHTVLNHLMTSSVKNGTLATSVTTRYKKKYVTTISFKPVPQPKPLPDQ